MNSQLDFKYYVPARHFIRFNTNYISVIAQFITRTPPERTGRDERNATQQSSITDMQPVSK